MTSFDSRTQPDWYPLEIHSEELSTLQLVGAIAFRVAVKTMWENTGNKDRTKKAFLELFPVSGDGLVEAANGLIGEPPHSLSVREQNVFEASYLTFKQTDDTRTIQDAARSCASSGLSGIQEKLDLDKSAIPSVMFQVSHEEIRDFLDSRISLSVNLNADDETLKRDFELWLWMIRRDVAEKRVSLKDLKRWRERKILAAFDLNLWASIHGGRYTASQLGAMLWSDEAASGAVDTTERYRKLAAPEVAQLFDWGTVERLIAQSISDRVHGKLDKIIAETSGTKSE